MMTRIPVLLVFVASLASAGAAVTYDQTSLFITSAEVSEGGNIPMVFTATFKHSLAPNESPALFSTAKVLWSTEPTNLPGGATPGVDFTSVNTAQFELASDRSGTQSKFSVNVLNDNIQEGTEYFNVRLFFAAGAAWENIQLRPADPQSANNNALVQGKILDDEGMTLSISNDKRREGAAAVDHFQFTVEMSHTADIPVEIFWNTVDQDAGAPGIARATVGPQQDYVSSASSLTFFTASDSSKKKSFSVAIHNDDLQEMIETFEVELKYNSPQGDPNARTFGFVPANRKAVGIFEKEFEHVTVCVEDQMVAEGAGDGQMLFSVVMSHSVDTIVKLAVTTAAGDDTSPKIAAPVCGTGVIGTCYYQANADITFAKGTDQRTHVLAVSQPNDNIQTPNAVAADQDIFGRINFKVQTTIAHDVWMGSTGDAANPWQVSACKDSTTRVGTAFGYIYDFEGVTMSISNSQTRSEAATDPAWTFSVVLSHKVYASGEARGAQFMLADQNGVMFDQVGDDTKRTLYGATVATNTLTTGCASMPSVGLNSEKVPDACWPVGMDQKKPLDFAGVSSLDPQQLYTVVFDHGPADVALEGTETFSVALRLTDQSSNGYRISINSGQSIGVGTITDDEVPVFTFKQMDVETNEKDVQTLQWDVSLPYTPARKVSLTGETADGTAVGGLDFQRINPTVKEWAPNTAKDTVQTWSTTIINDNIQEPTETFSMVFSNVKPVEIFTKPTVTSYTARITDNEGMTVSVSTMASGKDESEGSLMFTATLSHLISVDTVIRWNTEQSPTAGPTQAKEGARYSYQSGELTFKAATENSGTTTQVMFPVAVINDHVQTLDPAQVQTFGVRLSTATVQLIDATQQKLADDAQTGSLGVAKLLDNENPTVWISDATGNEGDLFIFTVYLSHEVTTGVAITYKTTVDEVCAASGLAASSISCAQIDGNKLNGRYDFTIENAATVVVPPNSRPFGAQNAGSPLTIVTQNDDVQELTETFNVQISSVFPNFVNVKNKDAKGTINDDEKMFITMTSSTVAEAAGAQLMFTVTASHAVSVPMNLAVEVGEYSALYTKTGNPGAAAIIYDFNLAKVNGVVPPPKTTVEIGKPVQAPSGKASEVSLTRTGTVTVEVVNDNVQELTETFAVRISRVNSPDFIVDLSQANGVGSITDAEMVTLEIGSDKKAKSAGVPLSFEIRLSHQVSSEVTVKWNTQSASAVAYDDATKLGDYISVVQSQVVFAPTITVDSNPGPYKQLAQVTAVRDHCQANQLPTNPETFQVVLTSVDMPQYNIQYANKVGVGTLTDNISPTIMIEDSQSNEGVNMVFTVKLSHCVNTDVPLRWDASDGTALSPTKFTTTVSARDLVFKANQVGASQATTFAVNIVNDDIQGPETTFTTKVQYLPSSQIGAMLGLNIARDTATGRIVDQEFATVLVTPCVDKYPSKGEKFLFTVSLSHLVDTDLPFNFTTVDQSAVSVGQNGAAKDFDATKGTFTFAQQPVNSNPSAQSKVFEVTVYDKPNSHRPAGARPHEAAVKFAFDVQPTDNHMSSRKVTFANGLTSKQGKGAILGKSVTRVELSADTSQVREGQNQVITATLQDEVNDDLTITVVPTGVGSNPTGPMDFSAAPLNFTFNKFSGPNQKVQFTVVITDDWLSAEGTENYQLRFTVAKPAAYHAFVDFTQAETQNFAIEDDDQATVEVKDASTRENSGPSALAVPLSDMAFTVQLSHAVAKSMQVNLQVVPSSVGTSSAQLCSSTGPVTAKSTCDFRFAAGSRSVAFNGTPDPLDKVAPFKLFTLEVLNDDVQETTETFTLIATDVSGVQLPGSKAGTGSIPDTENMSVEISNSEATEGDPIKFTVTMSHKMSAPTVVFETQKTTNPLVHMNAIPGAHFESVKKTLQTADFENGKQQVIQVITKKDDVATSDVTFRLAVAQFEPTLDVTDIRGGVGTIRSDRTATVISVGGPLASVLESNGQIVFDIQLKRAVDQNVALKYSTGGGTAVETTDYTKKEGTLVLTSQTGTQEIQKVTVDILNDNIVEGDETFSLNVAVTSPIDPAYVFDTPAGVGTILEDEQATLSVRAAAMFEEEATATKGMEFTVFLSHALEGSIDVTYFTTDGTAKSVDPFIDFLPQTEGHVVFSKAPQRLSTAIANIAIVNDRAIEARETFTLTLSKAKMLDRTNLLSLRTELKSATGSIIDNERATLTIEDASVQETVGDIVMTVMMSHAAEVDVAIEVRTFDGLATAVANPVFVQNSDYVAIAPNMRSFKSIGATAAEAELRNILVTVKVNDDNQQEIDEDFCVSYELISSGGASVLPVKQDGVIRLLNDAEKATIAIADAAMSEAIMANLPLLFTTTLSHPVQGGHVTVEWATESTNSALPGGKDYVDVVAGTKFATFAAAVTDTNSRNTAIQVEIVGDEIVEFDETFHVHLTKLSVTENAGEGIAGNVVPSSFGITFGRDTATGTITASTELATISVEDSTAGEAAKQLVFTVHCSHELAHEVVLDYITQDGSQTSTSAAAVVGEDFSTGKGKITFASGVKPTQGSVKQLVTVVVTDDHIVETNENFKLTLTPVDAARTPTLAAPTGKGTIMDDDTAKLTIKPASVSEEDGAYMQFTVEMTHDVQAKLSFRWNTAQSTSLAASVAQPGLDFEETAADVDGAALSETATLNMMTKSTTFSVKVINDNLQEPDHTFGVVGSKIMIDGIDASKVTFSSPSGVGTIKDDEKATVMVVSQTFKESVGTARFTVTLSHLVTTATQVNFAVTDETLKVTTDYVQVSKSPLVFGNAFDDLTAGNLEQDIQSIEFTVINDRISEQPLKQSMVTLSLPAKSMITLDKASSAAFIIEDDDKATVTIANAVGQEKAGKLTFTVTLSHEVDVEVPFDMTPSSASSATNVVAGAALGASNDQMTFNPATASFFAPDYRSATYKGSFAAKSKQATVDVTVYDDAEQECDEKFDVTLSQIRVGEIAYAVTTDVTQKATGSLTNDDENIRVIIDDVEAPESLPIFKFTASLSHSVDRPVKLNWKTAGSLTRLTPTTAAVATIEAHKSPAFKQAGSGAAFLNVAIKKDDIVQGHQTFNVEVSSVEYDGKSATCDLKLTAGSGVGTILDDDVATLSLAASKIKEGVFQAEATLSHTIATDVTVTWTRTLAPTAAGAATAADFSGDATGKVIFNAKGAKSFNVGVRADNIGELDEIFSLSLSLPGLADNLLDFITVAPATAVQTIVNDQDPLVFVDPVSALENAGTMTFIVRLDFVSDIDVTVQYTTADGTAKAGTHYETVSGTARIPAGSTQASPIPVKINDVDSDCNAGRTLSLVLSNIVAPPGRVVKFGPVGNTATSISGVGTIRDNDGTLVSVGEAQTKAGDDMSIPVTLSQACDYPVMVAVSASADSAKTPSDYSFTPAAVTIPANSLTAFATAKTVADLTATVPQKTFNTKIAVGAGMEPSIRVGTADGVAKILYVKTVVSFTKTMFVAHAEAVAFNVVLSSAVETPTTFTFDTQDGTARAGSQYTKTTKSITVPAGEQSAVVVVPLQRVAGYEVPRSFTATLSDPSEDVGIATGSSKATIEIHYPVDPEIQLHGESVVEGQDFVFDLHLNVDLASPLTVAWTTADGSATAGTHYTANSGTITLFKMGQSTPITIKTNQYQADKSVSFKLVFSSTDPVWASIESNPGDAEIHIRKTADKNSAPVTVFGACHRPLEPSANGVNLRLFQNSGNDKKWFKTFDANTCFFDPEMDVLTYDVTFASPNQLAADISGSMITVRSIGFQGTTTFTVTAKQANGAQATMTVTAIVTVAASANIADLIVTGKKILQGDSWQVVLGRFLNTDVDKNANGGVCSKNDILDSTQVSNNDCCAIKGNSVHTDVCQIDQPKTRQLKVVSARSIVHGIQPGLSTVCWGTKVTNCIQVETIGAHHVEPVPEQAVIAGTVLTIPLHIHGGTKIGSPAIDGWSTTAVNAALGATKTSMYSASGASIFNPRDAAVITSASVAAVSDQLVLTINTSATQAGRASVLVLVSDNYFTQQVEVWVDAYANTCL